MLDIKRISNSYYVTNANNMYRNYISITNLKRFIILLFDSNYEMKTTLT